MSAFTDKIDVVCFTEKVGGEKQKQAEQQTSILFGAKVPRILNPHKPIGATEVPVGLLYGESVWPLALS